MSQSDKQRPHRAIGSDAVPDSRPDAAHIASGFGKSYPFKSPFRPLDPEERATYRKWRQSALILYAVGALVLAGAVVTRSVTAPSPGLAGNSGAPSTVAIASKRHALD
jgi:hypothetical protein